jgi:membrane-bound lytic murein transglycosylase A
MNRAVVRIVLLLGFAAVLARCGTARPAHGAATLELDAASFSNLAGWNAADVRPALMAFLRSCGDVMGRSYDASLGGAGYAGKVADWHGVCADAARVPIDDAHAAQAFFMASFIPYTVKSDPPSDGLFTGYYEPVLRGSRLQHDQYQTPLYALSPGYEVPHAPRADIEQNGTSLPVLCYVDDKIDAFFLHIQGSGRVQLDDGTMIRAAYAGQNGYPYTAVGSVLLQRGEITHEAMSMQAIRAWLVAHPDEADALMDTNESYIFFVEKPVGDPTVGAEGAERVPLTPEASIAVDRSVHPFGVPIWIDAANPQPLQRLFVAQDTGGAIRGSVRADIYWGFGETAASTAGGMKSQGHMVVLLPKAVAARMGPHAVFPLP